MAIKKRRPNTLVVSLKKKLSFHTFSSLFSYKAFQICFKGNTVHCFRRWFPFFTLYHLYFLSFLFLFCLCFTDVHSLVLVSTAAGGAVGHAPNEPVGSYCSPDAGWPASCQTLWSHSLATKVGITWFKGQGHEILYNRSKHLCDHTQYCITFKAGCV